MIDTKHLAKRILSMIIVLLYIFTVSGCDKVEPASSKSYTINYELQGYLFMQTDEGRVFVENTTFTARNPSWPKTVKAGEMNSDKSAFEHISLRGFPAIDNETALNTSRHEAQNGLFKVDIIKGGAIRDSETGEVKLITEVRYILFIDEETEELLLCQIFAEMDGETQQYFFSPVRNPDHINDIMIRGYTT